ncbi:DUF4132 domain-containing protein [Glycomyces sp. A-F 0318]|uniref:DUF4132 domain-containing protein n=1 Tax=Glycomyces amatae TaxID=2881355 RepID=UPI001E60FB05|nr:DUF4132 domain-containing protein [Glycomyces amatae]
MNPNDSSSPLDEDRVDFPDAWREHTFDWRSRGSARPVEVDPDAPERLRKYFRDSRKNLERPLEVFEDPADAALLRDGIAGKADPLAAGLALVLLARCYHGERAEIHRIGLDAWITEHGVVFAAEALMEQLGHSVYWREGRSNWPPHASIDDLEVQALVRMRELPDRFGPLRSILAALPESEYAAVREAVSARRTSDAKRFVSAVLMPEQEAWAAEACDLHAATHWAAEGDLIWSVASTAAHRDRGGVQRLSDYYSGTEHVARLVDALGADALPVLVNTLEHQEKPSAELRRVAFDAIGRLPSDEALGYLLDRLTDPSAFTAAREAVRRFPTRALRAAAAIAPAADPAEKARLAGFARANGLLERLDALDAADRERVEALLSATRRRAVAAEVPPVFATPPWAPFAKAAKPKPVTGLEPPAVDEIRWAPGEREAWMQGLERETYFRNPMCWSRIYRDRDPAPDHGLFPEYLAYGPEERTVKALPIWNGSGHDAAPETIKAILARYGQDAVAKLLTAVKSKTSSRSVLLPVVNLEAARSNAVWLSRSRTERADARAWFDRHPADAAAFLIPDAVGKDAKRRRAAADALRHLANGHRTAVDERAAAYGPEAAAAVTAILDADPLDPQLARLPKPGAWADPEMLPQVRLKDSGDALPDAAVRTLLTALALDDAERLYPGADLLVAECEPASLTAFSWGLFELWLAAGAPTKDAWAMDQLRRFADDGTVRRLTALVSEWPGQSQSRRAVRGLEILGATGSEAALRAVHTLAQKAKFKALKKTATEQIEVIAERLELSLEQLADRLVPDFGLDAEDATVLDYGPRRFTIRFDEGLKPYVVDEAGKRRASAPKPNAKDDPELAQPAYERFALLRKELKATSAEQVKRLEAAMVAGRTWTAAEFRTYLVDHPLVWHLSSRLVWQAETAAGLRSFRLAEDRTLADAEDEPFDLPEDAAVRLAHPFSLGSEVEEWSTVLADYEILQPFDQLARTVYALTDEERESGRLARFEHGKVGAGAIVGLLKRGWKYGSPPGRSAYGDVFLEFPEGGHLTLHPSPGVYPGYDPGGDQTLEIAIALPRKGIDPVVLSEALGVVARLTRTA